MDAEHWQLIISHAVDDVRQLERVVDRYVAAARRDGLTWQQIADALGVSRSAAHQRYGGLVGV